MIPPKIRLYVLMLISTISFCGDLKLDPNTMVWTKQNSGVQGNLNAVAYGNNLFVAVGVEGSTGFIITSPDGVTWIKQNPEVLPSYFTDISWGNNQFVATGNVGVILTSSDGILWTDQESGYYSDLTSISYGNGLFLAAGNCYEIIDTTCTSESRVILTSSDGVSWSKQITTNLLGITGITWGNARYVATGRLMGLFAFFSPESGEIYSSSDGISWEISYKADSYFSGITFGNNQFVTYGLKYNWFEWETLIYIYISSDGINWTNYDPGIKRPVNAITWGNGQYILVGDSVHEIKDDDIPVHSTILSSPDGITWSYSEFDDIKNLYGITYGNNKYVAVGSEGTILTSP